MNHFAKLLLALLIAGPLALQSCKTTEANYQNAYERAMTGRNQNADSTVYTRIRQEMTQRDVVMGTDTIMVGTQFVSPTEDGGGTRESIKRYCVVAGQFKQVFTAKSLRERLMANGYPAAFVVQTREPYYFVIAGAFADLQPAMELAEKLRADQSLKLKAPIPFILNPAQIK